MARERYDHEYPYQFHLPYTDSSSSIVSLVLGSQPGKVYNNLRIIAGRMKERF